MWFWIGFWVGGVFCTAVGIITAIRSLGATSVGAYDAFEVAVRCFFWPLNLIQAATDRDYLEGVLGRSRAMFMALEARRRQKEHDKIKLCDRCKAAQSAWVKECVALKHPEPCTACLSAHAEWEAAANELGSRKPVLCDDCKAKVS